MQPQLRQTGQGQAIDALKSFIAEGAYGPGDRLPPERKLIDDLCMSRGVLRRALDVLEREGLIWRHVGKGTFVSSPVDARHSAEIGRIGRQLTPIKMMRARSSIEPAIAREAALNASSEKVAELHRIKERAVQAASWAEYEAEDDRFHRQIADACDNILLLSLFDRLNQVRRAVAWEAVVRATRRPPSDHSSFAEHEAIAAAIEARDPETAQRAMRRHIASVSSRLFGDVV